LEAAPHALTADAALPPAALERSQQFVDAMHAQRYLQSHAALQQVLASATSNRPGGVHAQVGPHGKPYFKQGPAHNMSRRDGWAAYVVGRTRPRGAAVLDGQGAVGELGIDIEPLREVDDHEALAQAHFTRKELSGLTREPRPPTQAGTHARALQDFLCGWTRKEAVIKAIGSGLSVEPCTFETGLTHEPRRVTVSTHDWRYEVDVETLPHRAGGQPLLIALACVVSRSRP
jgi:4'-phosphopantetheinyl transferase